MRGLVLTSSGRNKRLRFALLLAAILLCATLAGLVVVRSFSNRESANPGPARTESRGAHAIPKASSSSSADAASRSSAPPLEPFRAGSFALELASLKTSDGQRLLAYYQRGLAPSATVEEKFMAMEVIMACNGYANPKVLTHQAFAARPVTAEGSIVEQRREVLEDRCAPLDTVGREAWRAATERLSAELTALDSPFRPIRLTSEEGEPVSAEELEQARQQLRNQFDRYGPAVLDWSGGELLELFKIDKNRPGRMDFDEDMEVAGVALGIAPCMANQPCDSNSLSALGLCVGLGGHDCGDSVDATLLAQLPDAESRARAQRLANELLAAIGSRNWERLGL